MTKGVLLFAFNNEEINYIRVAQFAAKRISNFLDKPISLVTDSISRDSITENELFDKIILVDDLKNFSVKSFNNGTSLSKKASWKNHSRYQSFDLTPYDETLVLDVDYIINSKTLNYCWNQPHDFLIYKKSFDLAGWRNTKEFSLVSDYSIPFYWATAFYFKKNENTENFFSLVNYIKNNWQYYKFLYHIDGDKFRNDYAFSIAIHMMNGLSEGDFAKEFPGKMFYALDIDHFLKEKNNSLYFLIQKENKQGEYLPAKITGIDVHVMNKYSLMELSRHE